MNSRQLQKNMPKSIAFAEENGFTLGKRKGHYYFEAPTGHKVFVSGTPSDHRADKNTITYLRRCMLGDTAQSA